MAPLRLLNVEHVEEDGKAMLYLVRGPSEVCTNIQGVQRQPCSACSRARRRQVFEYLDTDLKKFMDATGRGPANPLPKSLVQASPCRRRFRRPCSPRCSIGARASPG